MKIRARRIGASLALLVTVILNFVLLRTFEWSSAPPAIEEIVPPAVLMMRQSNGLLEPCES
jgi:hypothetical protein